MTVATFQPDDTVALDTFIVSAAPTFNNGASTLLRIGERNDSASVARALLKFDLSSIPASAIITSATLSLSLQADLATNARTVRVYRMIRAWTEGTGINTASGDGATWNTYDGVNNWGTAGASNTTSDREDTDIGTAELSAAEPLDVFKNWVLTPSRVQEWISGAFANNGMLVKVDTETNDQYVYRSSGFGADQPKLVIDYRVGRIIAAGRTIASGRTIATSRTIATNRRLV